MTDSPYLVARPRLIGRLDELAELPLVAIRGPRGSGKSILLDQWVDHFDGADVIRIELTGPDVDPVRRAIIAGFAAIDRPGRPGARPPADDADSDDLDREVARLAADHFARGRSLRVIVDDQGGHLHLGHLTNFEQIVTAPPEGLHLVVATSHAMALPTLGLESAGRFGVIGREELAFTLAEVESLVARAVGRRVPRDRVEALHRRTAGWAGPVAAVVRAVADVAEAAKGAVQFTGDIVDQVLDDFVVTGVVRPLPEDLRSFLCDTFGSTELDPVVCDAVYDRSDSAAMIDELAAHQLLGDPVGARGTARRVPPLLVETLVRRADSLIGVDRARGLAKRSADWFASRDELARSIERLVVARDWDRSSAMANRNAAALTIRSDLRQALEVMTRVPDSVIRADRAGFQALITFHIAVGNITRATVLLSDYQSHLRAAPTERWIDETFVHGAWAAMGPWGLDAESVLAHAERALALMEHRPTDAGVSLGGGNPNWSRTVVLLAGAGALIDLDRPDEALAWLDDARRNPGRPHQAVRALATRGRIEAERGDLGRAADSAAQAARLAEGLSGAADWMIEVHLVQATVALRRGDLEEAESHLTRAAASQATRRPTDTETRLLVLRAEVELARGRFRSGLTLFDRWRTGNLATPSRSVETAMIATGVRLAVGYGQLDYARRLLVDSPGRVDPAAAALVAFVGGDRRRFAVVLDNWPRSVKTGQRIEYGLFRALQADERGDVAATRRFLSSVAEASAREGFVQVFVDHVPGSVELLRAEVDRDAAPLLAEVLARIDMRTGVVRAALEAVFSPREADVMQLMGTHLEAAAIAAHLGISLSTLKSHQKRIYRKLKVNRRGDAVARAVELGLLRPDIRIDSGDRRRRAR